MTEPNIQSDDPVQRPVGGGLGAAIAPEGVAAVVAIAVVAALLTVRLAGLGATGQAPTPRPTETASPGPTAPAPLFDRVAVNTVLGVNQRLLDYGRSIQVELEKPPISTTNVRQTMVQMNVQLLAGLPAVTRLLDSPATALVGADLGAVYEELRAEIALATAVKLADEPAWRAAATAVVKSLNALPSIDLRLEAIRAGLADPAGPVPPSVPPTLAPTASPAPSASPVATPPPTAPPTTQPTAPPPPGSSGQPSFAPTPSPPLAEPNQLENPGFETGVGSPWVLIRASVNAQGTVGADTTTPHSGKVSARIDVTATDGIPQSIYLKQDGVTIEQGATYRISIALRSSAARQIRLRVTSATAPDRTYVSLAPLVGPTWAVQTWDVPTFVGGSGLVFRIEVGQVDGSVWIDDVSIARVSPFAP
ncbi:MAG: carbohydrate binding domain-containing protein [Chloroflexota bacterium]